MLLSDSEAFDKYRFWSAGSLVARDLDSTLQLAPFIAVGVLLCLVAGRMLNALALGDDLARVTVRFLAEFRSRTKGPEGEGVDDKRTAELWTFERHLKSRDPNWTLVHVDAAEA